MDDINIFAYRINVIISTIVAILSAIFGDFWFLFAFLLLLNIFDYITGTMKARYLRQESAKKGFTGFTKTLFTWILVAVSFGVGICFVKLGEKFEFKLDFMISLGWFMLTHCIINELRSIIENIIQMDKGDMIPSWLISGLEVAQNLVNKKANSLIENLNTENSIKQNENI